jgi:hypothetical protein
MDTGTSLIHVLHVSLVTQRLCQFVPHGVHPTCKVRTFLRLRTTCRAAVPQISSQMSWRVAFMLHHVDEAVRLAGQHIKDSGFMFHLLFCGGRRKCDGFLRMNEQGLPQGMSEAYWVDRQRKLLKTGWIEVHHEQRRVTTLLL